MFDVYADGNDGAHCHSITNVNIRDSSVILKRKMSQRYIDAEHFRNIGAIKHFMAYLVGSFGQPGGYLKEIDISINESEVLNLKLKACCCCVSQFCSRDFSGPISDATVLSW